MKTKNCGSLFFFFVLLLQKYCAERLENFKPSYFQPFAFDKCLALYSPLLSNRFEFWEVQVQGSGIRNLLITVDLRRDASSWSGIQFFKNPSVNAFFCSKAVFRFEPPLPLVLCGVGGEPDEAARELHEHAASQRGAHQRCPGDGRETDGPVPLRERQDRPEAEPTAAAPGLQQGAGNGAPRAAEGRPDAAEVLPRCG